MAIRLQVRRDTSTNWSTNNPILQVGEFGFDTTVNRFKVGIASNETSRWNALPYLNVIPSELKELAQDFVEEAITAGTGITKSYNDAANTLTIAVDSTIANKAYVDDAVSALDNTAADTYIPLSLFGNADGVATLDEDGYVPQTQLTNTIDQLEGYVDTAVSGLVNSAPATLDTLKELSDALGSDANFATTTATALGTKITASSSDTLTNKTINLASNTFTGTKAQFDTALSDANFATLAGTEELLNKTLNSPIINQPTGLLKADVGLGDVDNTSDANKPISTAAQTALDLKQNRYASIQQKSANYQLQLSDANTLIEVSATATISIPTDASVNFPKGTAIDFVQTATATVNFAAVNSGVTVVNGVGAKLRTTWSSATLIKRDPNLWVLVGDLIP